MADSSINLPLDLCQLEPATPVAQDYKAKRKPRTPQEVAVSIAAIALSKGGILEAALGRGRYLLRCQNGHKWEGLATNIERGAWCYMCSRVQVALLRRKHTLNEVQEFVKKYGGECLSIFYKSTNARMNWKCSEGHKFTKTFAKVKGGRWCPRCRAWSREEICRLIIERLYDVPFPMSWPEWLVSNKSNRLSLDGFNKNLRLAFEHQGRQHFDYIEHFHGEGRGVTLEQQREIDASKEWKCGLNNVALLKIPYWIEIIDLPRWIIDNLVKIGAPLPRNGEEACYPLHPASGRSRLQKLHELAASHGGMCLSTVYTGVREKYQFQCSRGHKWEAVADSVKRGTWCRKCAFIKSGDTQRLTIEQMQKYAESFGGKCLSTNYTNYHAVLTWECSKGHKWLATPNNSYGKLVWCPDCRKEKPRELGIARMRHITEERGGKCLSNSYVNPLTKLNWQCAVGHKWWSAPNTVDYHVSWCPTCAKLAIGSTTRLSINEMHKVAKAKNGKCLSTVYRNSNTALHWECSAGHDWWASLNRVKNFGSWCPACFNISRAQPTKWTIEKMHELAEKRGGKCLSDKYTNPGTHLHWICALGHDWWATPNSIKDRLSWCVTCYKTRRGETTRLTIEEMKEIAELRGGKCLSTNYKNMITKLRWQCAIGHEWSATANSVKTNGTWCPECAKIRIANSRRLTIEQMHEISRQRGGECLSTTYAGIMIHLQWRCAEGHSFSATPNSIKNMNSWCPVCARATRSRTYSVGKSPTQSSPPQEP